MNHGEKGANEMELETIIFNISERRGYLTFNRPHVRNAINKVMINELEQVLEQIKQKDDIDVLFLTGNDISFCAGADTTEFLTMTAEENQIFLNRFANCSRN
jgi:enoyl-CoA hydratase/carnithine racemase